MIVETEKEKIHDELVKDILRRMKKNNLYMKPEKYKWKVREIEFLEVVIEPKIEKEKMKMILEWQVSQTVKEV